MPKADGSEVTVKFDKNLAVATQDGMGADGTSSAMARRPRPGSPVVASPRVRRSVSGSSQVFPVIVGS